MKWLILAVKCKLTSVVAIVEIRSPQLLEERAGVSCNHNSIDWGECYLSPS